MIRPAPRVYFVWQVYKNGGEDWDGPFDDFGAARRRLKDLLESESNLVSAHIVQTYHYDGPYSGRGTEDGAVTP